MRSRTPHNGRGGVVAGWGGRCLDEPVTLCLQRSVPFSLCPWLCAGSQLWGASWGQGVHLDLGQPSQGQAKAGRLGRSDYTSLPVQLLSRD